MTAEFSPVLGYFLIILAGAVYTWIIELGIRFQRILPSLLKILALPIAWTAIEWLIRTLPITREWWFALLAYSQWNFPPALQILSITGFPGLSFIIMLVNSSLAILIIYWLKEKKFNLSAAIGVLSVIIIVIIGATIIPIAPTNKFIIGATTDLSIQDKTIQTENFSQNVFDINAQLTKKIVNDLNKEGKNLSFIVWPENKFFIINEGTITEQLKQLADDLDIYIAVNGGERAEIGVYNMAFLFGPDGQEVGRQAKIHLARGERGILGYKVIPKEQEYWVFNTNYGKIGLAVCYDIFFTDVVRNLAKNGAQIVLVPVNADFNSNLNFPIFFTVEAIFRAVENNVAIGIGTTSGISTVIDPYGRISAMSGINTREVIAGEVFIREQQPTIYTQFGDWFPLLILILLMATTIPAIIIKIKSPDNK